MALDIKMHEAREVVKMESLNNKITLPANVNIRE